MAYIIDRLLPFSMSIVNVTFGGEQTYGRTDGHVMAKISSIYKLPFLITHGAQLCERESFAMTCHFVFVFKRTEIYTCQFSRIMRESHACGLKTSISRIKDNFSSLTHKSGQIIP